MRVERIEVLSFYVKDLERAVKFFSELMGTQFIGPVVKTKGAGLQARMAFSKAIGNVSLQLTQPTSPDQPIAKWIDEHGEGLALLGLKVPDVDEAVAELEAKGFTLRSRSLGSTVVSAGGKTVPGKSDLRVATLWAPGNAYGGLIFYLLEYKEAPGFVMAHLRKLGDVPWM